MNWLKRTIRAFLGLDALPSVEMYKAMELRQRERDIIAKDRHAEILTILHALEIQKQNAGPQAQSIPRQWDWETVQAMALKQLEDENKEN